MKSAGLERPARGALLVSETYGAERRDEIIRALRDAAVPVAAPGEAAQAADGPGAAAATGAGIRLLLLADEPIFREGLLRLLDRYPAVRVVAWTDRVDTAVLMAPTHCPDALLACVHPMAQVHHLARQLAGTPILALVPAPTMDDIVAATAVGVRGVLDRTAEIDDIVEALRVVRRGLVVHPPVAAGAEMLVAEDMGVDPAHPGEEPAHPGKGPAGLEVEAVPAGDEERPLVAVNGNGVGPRAGNGLAPDLGLLTPREREILQLLVDGYSVKQVASRLGIAMQTGKNHIHNIMSKVGASTRLQLCAWANDRGMHPSRPLLPRVVSDDDGF